MVVSKTELFTFNCHTFLIIRMLAGKVGLLSSHMVNGAAFQVLPFNGKLLASVNSFVSGGSIILTCVFFQPTLKASERGFSLPLFVFMFEGDCVQVQQ